MLPNMWDILKDSWFKIEKQFYRTVMLTKFTAIECWDIYYGFVTKTVLLNNKRYTLPYYLLFTKHNIGNPDIYDPVTAIIRLSVSGIETDYRF